MIEVDFLLSHDICRFSLCGLCQHNLYVSNSLITRITGGFLTRGGACVIQFAH